MASVREKAMKYREKIARDAESVPVIDFSRPRSKRRAGARRNLTYH
jgi:hypothetical protein